MINSKASLDLYANECAHIHFGNDRAFLKFMSLYRNFDIFLF